MELSGATIYFGKRHPPTSLRLGDSEDLRRRSEAAERRSTKPLGSDTPLGRRIMLIILLIVLIFMPIMLITILSIMLTVLIVLIMLTLGQLFGQM